MGEFKEENESHLVVDSETYLLHRIHSGYSKLMEYFTILDKYGVHCRIVPLMEEGWLTPTGALRKKGWILSMSFDESSKGVSALKALSQYTNYLNEHYGKSAFRYFTRADMRDLYL